MVQKNYAFLAGLLSGLGIVIATIAVFSISATPTLGQENSAQSSNQNQMNQQMMLTGGDMAMDQMNMNNQSGMHQGSMSTSTMMEGMSIFSSEGMSMVDDVKVIGVTISGDKEISVQLRYVGNGTAPGVTAAVMTHTRDMMSMMGSNSCMNMMNNGMQGHENMMMTNDEGSNSMHQTMMAPTSGSNVLNAGWKSPSTITVKLQGNATAYEAAHTMVMVFPFIK